MFDKSYIVKSGNGLKLIVGLCVLFIGGISGMFADLLSAYFVESKNIFILSGLSVCITASLYLVYSIRCPKCNSKLLWNAVSSKSYSTWLTELLIETRCQKCNHTYD